MSTIRIETVSKPGPSDLRLSVQRHSRNQQRAIKRLSPAALCRRQVSPHTGKAVTDSSRSIPGQPCRHQHLRPPNCREMYQRTGPDLILATQAATNSRAPQHGGHFHHFACTYFVASSVFPVRLRRVVELTCPLPRTQPPIGTESNAGGVRADNYRAAIGQHRRLCFLHRTNMTRSWSERECGRSTIRQRVSASQNQGSDQWSRSRDSRKFDRLGNE